MVKKKRKKDEASREKIYWNNPEGHEDMTLKGRSTKFLISMVSDVYGQIVHIYAYRSDRERKRQTNLF